MVGVAIGAWSTRVLIPPAIRKAGDYVVGIAAAAELDLTHLSARELEILEAPSGCSQISPVSREGLVLA